MRRRAEPVLAAGSRQAVAAVAAVAAVVSSKHGSQTTRRRSCLFGKLAQSTEGDSRMQQSEDRLRRRHDTDRAALAVVRERRQEVVKRTALAGRPNRGLHPGALGIRWRAGRLAGQALGAGGGENGAQALTTLQPILLISSLHGASHWRRPWGGAPSANVEQRAARGSLCALLAVRCFPLPGRACSRLLAPARACSHLRAPAPSS